MKKICFALTVLCTVLLCGCSIQDMPNTTPEITKETLSAKIDDREAPGDRTDITSIVSFLDNYNHSVDSGLQMNDYEVTYEQDLDVYFAANESFRIAFRLDEDGKVQSALYQDGLSRSDRDKVAMALVKILAANDSMGSLQDESSQKRADNDAYTQELVDAIDGFGSIGTPPSGNPEVSLKESELSEPEMFSQSDLQAPQVEAPAGTTPAKNPNEPDLPEIGNFGKMP